MRDARMQPGERRGIRIRIVISEAAAMFQDEQQQRNIKQHRRFTRRHLWASVLCTLCSIPSHSPACDRLATADNDRLLLPPSDNAAAEARVGVDGERPLSARDELDCGFDGSCVGEELAATPAIEAPLMCGCTCRSSSSSAPT